jgi:hypothetical protein
VSTFVSYCDVLSDLKHPFVSIRTMLKTAARHKSKPLALEQWPGRVNSVHEQEKSVNQGRRYRTFLTGSVRGAGLSIAL